MSRNTYNVVDQADGLARGPNTRLGVAECVHGAATRARDKGLEVLELGALALEAHDLLRDVVLKDTRRVAQRTQDVHRVALTRVDDLLLDLVVDLALLGRHEARAHVGTLRTEGKRRSQAATVRDTARSNVRRLDLVGSERKEHQSTNVVLTGVTRAFACVSNATYIHQCSACRRRDAAP